MKRRNIIFFGDSITDMGRTKLLRDYEPWSNGIGYPQFISGYLDYNYPNQYRVINKGISGNRSIDLMERIETDVWSIKPDYLVILIGANDVWHGISCNNGVDIKTFENVYSKMIEETKKRIKDVNIILMEPFILQGIETEERYDDFLKIRDYAKVVKRISEKYNLTFIPLQDKFDEESNKNGVENYLYDGVHPAAAGAYLIAQEFIKTFINIKK